MIMKSIIQAIATVAVLAVPAASFAQSNQPLTRAQVRAELVQLEKAGYRPGSGERTNYPVRLQAAEAKVAAENAQTAMAQTRVADSGGMGGMTAGSSASGTSMALRTPGMRSIYAGH
jgi:hypothetical protein